MLLMTSFFLKNSSIPSSRSKNIRPNRCALGFGAGFVQAALKEGGAVGAWSIQDA